MARRCGLGATNSDGKGDRQIGIARRGILNRRVHYSLCGINCLWSRRPPSTINLRLAAVRRLAYEAADSGLLSPELAAHSARQRSEEARHSAGKLVHGVPSQSTARCTRPGMCPRQARSSNLGTVARLRLRGSEVVHLTVENLQQREERWVIVDLVGKGGHIRTVPVPEWVKSAIDGWMAAANIRSGRLFRCVSKTGSVWGPA